MVMIMMMMVGMVMIVIMAIMMMVIMVVMVMIVVTSRTHVRHLGSLLCKKIVIDNSTLDTMLAKIPLICRS